MGRTWEARVQEYIDSPMMVQRLRSGTLATARIHGTTGTYRVTVDTATGVGDCTCPSPDDPCKHVAALAETFRRKRSSFVDVDRFLKGFLKDKDLEELVEIIRSMAMEAPASLAVLGVEGVRDYVLPEEVEDW